MVLSFVVRMDVPWKTAKRFLFETFKLFPVG